MSDSEKGKPAGTNAGGGTQPPAAVGLYAELVRETQALHRTRYLVSFVLLAIFLTFGVLIYTIFAGFSPDAFKAAVQARAEEMKPQLLAAAEDVIRKNADVVTERVNDVAERRLPTLRRKFSVEMDLLVDNIGKRAREKLIDQLAKQLNKRGDEILKRFPELGKDDKRDKLLIEIQRLSREAVEAAVTEEMDSCHQSIIRINKTLGRKEIRSEIEALKLDPNLTSKVAGHFLAVLGRSFHEGTALEASSKKKDVKDAKGK